MDVLGDSWTLLIVRDLLLGLHRFGELERSLKIPKNTLTTRLRSLVANGLVEAAPASDGSAYLEYLPTQKARDLLPAILALRQWGKDYFSCGGEDPVLVDARDDQPVARIEVRAHDGRVLRHDEVRLKRPPGTDAPAG